jgi:hypothetical protein
MLAFIGPLGGNEFLIGFIPMLIWIGVTIYLISLLVRLVRAVEKIAGKMDKQ